MTELLTKPLLSKFGIILLGSNKSTGFGKTQFALRLAVEYCKAYSEVMQLPKENAVVLLSNTIDIAREVQFKLG